jgi:hypothetical protein
VEILRSVQQLFNQALKQSRQWVRWYKHPNDSADLTLEEQKTLLTKLLLLLDRSKEPEKFIASFSQQGLWVLNQLDPITSAYNLQVGLQMRGHLDRKALELSLQEIVNRHDILRTRFELEETQLSQIVVPDYSVSLPLLDLAHLETASRYAAAYESVQCEIQVPFDLTQVPLFRLKLIRLAPDDHILICILDHIISDGWSLGILIRELRILYGALSSGKQSTLAPLAIQYGDYAQWQRQRITGELLRNQIDYWRTKLSGAPPLLDLSMDRVRPGRQTLDGASQTVPLSKDLVRDLKKLSKEQDATLFMVTHAAFNILLSRYSGETDILIGVPVAGRNRVETEQLIGFFVNTVVLRTDLSGNPRFCDLLAQVRQVVIEALCNSDTPFVTLVEELKPTRSLSYHPIFQVMFAVIVSAVQSSHFGALSVSPYVVTSRTSRFDLTMNLIESADEHWAVQVEYHTTLFDHERIAKMLGHYLSVLAAIAAEPQLPISDLPIPSAAGQHQFACWNTSVRPNE